MSRFSSLRFMLSMMFNAADYNVELIKLQNRKFFNNSHKIIGWYKGYPSVSLYTPPFFSKPSANSLITRGMCLYQWKKLPELMSIAVTPVCNCDCQYCSFTSMKSDKNPLTTEEIKKAIKDAQHLGVSTLSIVGGEPLMNNDIIDIIKSVDKDLSQVVLFTNGYYLKEFARDLAKAGLTSVIVSIDSPDADNHDRIKGLPGLFDRALEGIIAVKKNKMLVGVSSVVHKEDLQNGTLLELFGLVKNLKINEHVLYDAISTGNYRGRNDLLWSKEERDKLIDLCEEYSKKRQYPNIFPYAYFKSERSIGCAGGTIYFYLSPYGDVCPCDFNSFSVGNIRQETLYQLWDNFNRTKDYCGPASSECKAYSHIPTA